MRRKRITVAFRDASLANLRAFPIVVDTETDRHAWGSTLALSERFGLTPYDASYLELAQRLRLPLAACLARPRVAHRVPCAARIVEAIMNDLDDDGVGTGTAIRRAAGQRVNSDAPYAGMPWRG